MVEPLDPPDGFKPEDFAETARLMRAYIGDADVFRAVMSNNFNVIFAALDRAAAQPAPDAGVVKGLNSPTEADLEHMARALCGDDADEDYNGRDAQMPYGVPMKRWELYLDVAKRAYAALATPVPAAPGAGEPTDVRARWWRAGVEASAAALEDCWSQDMAMPEALSVLRKLAAAPSPATGEQ